MAKLSRGQLKSIVKECLVEILSEGISAAASEPVSRKRKTTSLHERRRVNEPRLSRPALDMIKFGVPKEPPPTNPSRNGGFDNAISSAVGALTDDPMMAAIFSDTATGTLQEQLSADVGPGAQLTVEHVADPISTFGDAAANWATLAFADKKPR